MAVCTTRDNPAPRRHIAEYFGGRVMNDQELFRFAKPVRVAGVEHWRYGQAPRVRSANGEPPVLVLDGVAHHAPSVTLNAPWRRDSDQGVRVLDPFGGQRL